MVSSIPSSFPELYGAASVASHQEPGLSLVLKCGWTGTPGKPVPGLVWLPPSPGYAPFDWLLPCPEVERHFTKRISLVSALHVQVKALWWCVDWPLAWAEPRWAIRWRVRGCRQPGPSCTCSLTAGCTALALLLGPSSAVWTERHSWGRGSRMREAG